MEIPALEMVEGTRTRVSSDPTRKDRVCGHACAHGLTHLGVTHKEIPGVTFTKMLHHYL